MRRVEMLGGDLVARATEAASGWQRLAARALLDLDPAARDALSAFPEPDAAFYRAAAAWIDGDQDTAISVLESLPDLIEARELLALIRPDRVDVLAFMPEAGEYPLTLIDAAVSDRKFRMRNVGFETGTIRNVPGADIRALAGTVLPAFIVVGMIEWPVLPWNLRALGCPVIGHTCDFDLHIQPVLPLLRQFDVVLTAEKIGSSNLEGLVGTNRSVTYPEIWAMGVPSKPNIGPRPVDFTMTNTVFSDVHRDKEEIIKSAISDPSLKYILYNGSLSKKNFESLMGTSKLTLDYFRRSGFTTRAIQALAAGCCCLVRPDTFSTIFIPPNHGLVPTDFDDPSDIARQIRGVVHEEPERYRAEAQRGAEFVWRRFSTARIGSRYLRFSTLMAAFTRAGSFQAVTAPPPAYTKRTATWRGWMPHNGHPSTINAVREADLRLIANADLPEHRRANDEGRALVCDHTLFAHRMRQLLSDDLAIAALDAFRRAMTARPLALAPAFNFVRTAFHFGRETDKADAEEVARRIVANPCDTWEIGFDDDVLPYDFFSAFCHQRRLTELLCLEANKAGSQRADLVATILASVHFYLGWRTESAEHFRQAVNLDGQFVDARLELARCLVAEGDGEGALPILAALGDKYLLTAELPYLRYRASILAGDAPPEPVEADFALQLVDFMNDYFSDFPTVARAVRRQFAESELLIWRREIESRRISVVVLDHHLRWQPEIAALNAERKPLRDQFELVHVDVYARLDERALIWCDTVVRQLDPMAIVEHRGRTLMKAFKHARGEIIFFAERLDTVTPALLVQAGDVLDRAGDPSLVTIFSTGPTGEKTCRFVGIRRSDFLRLEGFDLSGAAQGSRGGVHELVWRARNAGFQLLEPREAGFAAVEYGERLSLMPASLDHVEKFLTLAINDDWDQPLRTEPIRKDPKLLAG